MKIKRLSPTVLLMLLPVLAFAQPESDSLAKPVASSSPVAISSEELADLIAQLRDPAQANRLSAVLKLRSLGSAAAPAKDALEKFLMSEQCDSFELRKATAETLGLIVGREMTAVEVPIDMGMSVEKPAIYLYPPELRKISIEVVFEGRIPVAFPRFDKGITGWSITASPDGRIVDSRGRNHRYLFWEGELRNLPDFSRDEGFIVKGSDSLSFFEEVLPKIGLSEEEANDFTVYWYPRLLGNRLNYVHFLVKRAGQIAELKVSPKPESILRVFMMFEPIIESRSVRPQEFIKFERKGFSLVEWGGVDISSLSNLKAK